MEILTVLIPASLLLGGIGLAAFLWAMKTRQFDDPEGDANRILTKDWDDHPRPSPTRCAGRSSTVASVAWAAAAIPMAR